MTKPRKAKVHAQRLADLYVRTGWKLTHSSMDVNGEPYEYCLEWTTSDDPIDPVPSVGDLVVMIDLPSWTSTLPSETQAVFRSCQGRAYRVVEVDSQGLFVLDVSANVDPRFGGRFNDIRLNLEDLTKAEAVARRRPT